MILLVTLIDYAATILTWAILIRAVMSWIRPRGYSSLYYQIEGILDRIAEPVQAPIRRIMPASWGVDFSPWIAIVLIGLVRQLLIGVLLGGF